MSEVPIEIHNPANDVMYDYNSDETSDSDDEDDDGVSVNVSQTIIQPEPQPHPQPHPLYHDNEQEITIIDENPSENISENTSDNIFWNEVEEGQVVSNNENNMSDFSYNYQYSSYYDISYSSYFNTFVFQRDGFVQIPVPNEETVELNDSDKENEEGLNEDELNEMIDNLSLD